MTASTQADHGEDDLGWRKDAAFTLHQAAERAYTCFLLVRTHYVPRSHNLKFLRSLAEDKEPRLVEAWLRATKLDRRRFELAKRAYVEARYSASYKIGSEDLTAITDAVRSLRDTVEAVSLNGLKRCGRRQAYSPSRNANSPSHRRHVLTRSCRLSDYRDLRVSHD